VSGSGSEGFAWIAGQARQQFGGAEGGAAGAADCARVRRIGSHDALQRAPGVRRPEQVEAQAREAL
jgi:hypothetical protein